MEIIPEVYSCAHDLSMLHYLISSTAQYSHDYINHVTIYLSSTTSSTGDKNCTASKLYQHTVRPLVVAIATLWLPDGSMIADMQLVSLFMTHSCIATKQA